MSSPLSLVSLGLRKKAFYITKGSPKAKLIGSIWVAALGSASGFYLYYTRNFGNKYPFVREGIQIAAENATFQRWVGVTEGELAQALQLGNAPPTLGGDREDDLVIADEEVDPIDLEKAEENPENADPYLREGKVKVKWTKRKVTRDLKSMVGSAKVRVEGENGEEVDLWISGGIPGYREKMLKEAEFEEDQSEEATQVKVEADDLLDMAEELKAEGSGLSFYWENPWEIKFAMIRTSRRMREKAKKWGAWAKVYAIDTANQGFVVAHELKGKVGLEKADSKPYQLFQAEGGADLAKLGEEGEKGSDEDLAFQAYEYKAAEEAGNERWEVFSVSASLPGKPNSMISIFGDPTGHPQIEALYARDIFSKSMESRDYALLSMCAGAALLALSLTRRLVSTRRIMKGYNWAQKYATSHPVVRANFLTEELASKHGASDLTAWGKKHQTAQVKVVTRDGTFKPTFVSGKLHVCSPDGSREGVVHLTANRTAVGKPWRILQAKLDTHEGTTIRMDEYEHEVQEGEEVKEESGRRRWEELSSSMKLEGGEDKLKLPSSSASSG